MFERWQFSRTARRIRARYEPQIENSFEENDFEKSKKLHADMYLRLDTLQMQIEDWECNQQLLKAHQLDLEQPFYKDQTLWETVGYFRVLNSTGRLTIRKAIDEEKDQFRRFGLRPPPWP